MTDYVYVLRCVREDMISTNGFQWPRSGAVECPDWNPKPECGYGLHGWLWGSGTAHVARDVVKQETAVWLVAKVLATDVVDLADKVKFPRGEVVFSGNRGEAAARIRELGATGAVIGTTVASSTKLDLMGGDYSTITGGDGSTLNGGDWSKLNGGDYSRITGGDRSTITGGHESTLTGGNDSTITGGDDSTLTGGNDSTITGGTYSRITGGDFSTITGGYRSTITGGTGSMLTGGDESTLTFSWHDGGRIRLTTVYVGENGIEPGVAYVCNNGVVTPKS